MKVVRDFLGVVFSMEAVDEGVRRSEYLMFDFLLDFFVVVAVSESGNFLVPGLDHVVEPIPAGFKSFCEEGYLLFVPVLLGNGGHQY